MCHVLSLISAESLRCVAMQATRRVHCQCLDSSTAIKHCPPKPKVLKVSSIKVCLRLAQTRTPEAPCPSHNLSLPGTV
jgi:hypothetical protein